MTIEHIKPGAAIVLFLAGAVLWMPSLTGQGDEATAVVPEPVEPSSLAQPLVTSFQKGAFDEVGAGVSDDIGVKIDTLLTIGAGADGDVEYIFGNPTFIEVDTKGKIYVADAATMTARVFDHSGDFVASVGGRTWSRTWGISTLDGYGCG
jgi:hypothetical protein